MDMILFSNSSRSSKFCSFRRDSVYVEPHSPSTESKPSKTPHQPSHCRVGCPRNNQIFFSVRTETNRNSICFGCFSVCFAKQKNIFFGLFRCFGPVLKQPKQTEFSRNKPKQTEKIPKNVIY